MDISKKAELISEFFITERDNPIAQDWIQYNDLGIPFALGLENNLITLTKEGEEEVEETWRSLCEDELEIDKDKSYDDIQDMYDESRTNMYDTDDEEE